MTSLKGKRAHKRYSKRKIGSLMKEVCENYATGIYTIESVCNNAGVPYRTFRSWIATYDSFGDEIPEEWIYFAEFAEMYKWAQDQNREVYRFKLVEKAQTGLEKRIMGYEYEEVRTEEKEVIDENGNKTFKPYKIVKITKYNPPSVSAIIFALKKLLPEIFGDVSKEISVEVPSNIYEGMTITQIEELIKEEEEALRSYKRKKK